MGKTVGEGQAELICKHFDVVIHVPDRDAAGDKSRQCVQSRLAGKVAIFTTELTN
jgi:hypothetical protein